MKFSWEWGNPERVLERQQEMSKPRERVRIPADLREADELLDRFGRWAQDRYRKQRCASAEGQYRSPDFWHDGELPEPLIADFRAMDVNRALNRVPLQYRRVLHSHYIPQRPPIDAQRRAMMIPIRLWDETHIAGLRMFWNNWRLHDGKRAT